MKTLRKVFYWLFYWKTIISGGKSKEEIYEALRKRSIYLPGKYIYDIIESGVFNKTIVKRIKLVRKKVRSLGFNEAQTIPAIISKANAFGLRELSIEDAISLGYQYPSKKVKEKFLLTVDLIINKDRYLIEIIQWEAGSSVWLNGEIAYSPDQLFGLDVEFVFKT